jgi:hypothetical protein
MLAADGVNPLGYMFQAPAEQKADAGMVANYLPQTAPFYIKNGIRIPSAPEIAIATQRSNTIRDTAAALTKLAAVASGATALVGLSPTLLTWALGHPAEATSLGMITTETAAAIQSGAITPALVMEAGAVKAGVTGSVAGAGSKAVEQTPLVNKISGVSHQNFVGSEINTWSQTKNLSSTENAIAHWTKHSIDFPELKNVDQYAIAAKNFVINPPANTLSKVRLNGDTVLYNPETNIFAIKASDGTPRTMFRPDPQQHGYLTNLDYFNAQK